MDCSVPKQTNGDEQSAVCRECGKEGRRVKKVTVVHMLKNPFLKDVMDDPFCFCRTPGCNVAYFCNESEQYFSKEQVRIRIGVKETDHPVAVCYCFDYTEQLIFDQIRETGCSDAAEKITENIKEKLCACEIRNPSGRCCLGTVKTTIKKGMGLSETRWQ